MDPPRATPSAPPAGPAHPTACTHRPPGGARPHFHKQGAWSERYLVCSPARPPLYFGVGDDVIDDGRRPRNQTQLISEPQRHNSRLRILDDRFAVEEA